MKTDLVLGLYFIIFGMIFGGGIVLGEIVVKKIIVAVKDFTSGFRRAGRKKNFEFHNNTPHDLRIETEFENDTIIKMKVSEVFDEIVFEELE